MYKVLFKGFTGGFQLSDEMDLELCKEFKNKCLKIGYKEVYIIQIIE
jgi:hypothetical protein